MIMLFEVAAIYYSAATSKGFPDGHLTELDHAEQPLFYFSSILSGLAGLFLFYLARFSKTKDSNRSLYRTLIFLLIILIVILSLDWYFVSTLDDGVGG